MNITRKDIDQNNATITIGIDKSDYSEKVEKTLREYRKKANIPGFRPGMVPVGLVKKMYGKAILAEEINKLVSDSLYAYIQDNNVNLLGEPLPNETEQNAIDFETQESFEFIFDLGIAPEFEVELTKKDKITAYDIAVSEEMIENQVKSYTGRYGKYVQEEVVEEKDMIKGDLIELENGQAKESGITVENATLTALYIKDEAQKALFVGAKKGDVVVFNPSKAYENETEISSMLKITKEEALELKSDFQITIESITRYQESEINQELFDKVYGEGVVTSEEEFKSKIKESIKENLTADSNYKFAIDARETLLGKFKDLAFPDEFLKRWVLATNKNLTQDDLDKDYSKMIDDLKWQLIKDKVAKKNDVKVEAADVESYAKKMAKAQFAQYGMVGLEDSILENYAKDILKKEETFRSIVERVAEEKIVEVIKESVKLDSKEISIEDFNKLFEAQN